MPKMLDMAAQRIRNRSSTDCPPISDVHVVSLNEIGSQRQSGEGIKSDGLFHWESRLSRFQPPF